MRQSDPEYSWPNRKPSQRRSSRGRSSRSSSGGSRKYTRYDPVSGRKASVTEDDPRFDEWPTRKPTLEQRKFEKLRQDPVGTVRETVSKSVARGLGRAVGQGSTAVGKAIKKRAPEWATRAKAVAAVALPLLAKATLVGAAGYAAYWLTTKLRSVRYRTWDDVFYELANKVRHARQAAAAEYGRPLTPDELKSFGDWHKGELAKLQAMRSRGVPVGGFKFGD